MRLLFPLHARFLLAFTLILGSACTHGEPPVQEAIVRVSPAQRLLPHESAITLRRIAFGSCNKQYLPQPLWRKLGAENADLFIWTGDVIYADTERMDVLAREYQKQLTAPEYEAFVASGIPLIGVYDDHDYGENNGGASYAPKARSAQLFLDFIGEPKASQRRQQDGIYTSYLSGAKGQRIKTILLDTRYNREPEGPKSDLLGPRQWQWLEAELKKDDFDLLLLVSSIQVLPFEHRFEKWANFPAARQRLLALLDQMPPRPLLLISGDRHFAEFSQLTLPSGRTLFEVTSSGLTHSYSAFQPEKNVNSLRKGPVLTRLNYGILDVNWEQGQLRVEVRDINRQASIVQVISLR